MGTGQRTFETGRGHSSGYGGVLCGYSKDKNKFGITCKGILFAAFLTPPLRRDAVLMIQAHHQSMVQVHSGQ